MHLDTVLILFIINIEHEKALLFLQFIDCLYIDFEWSEGSHILIHIGQTATWKIFVMWGAKNKDSFNVVRSCHILISPGCSWSAEIKTCMRSNQSFNCFGFFIFLGSIDVFSHFGIQLSSWLLYCLRLLVYHSPAWRHWRYLFSIDSHEPFIIIQDSRVTKSNLQFELYNNWRKASEHHEA